MQGCHSCRVVVVTQADGETGRNVALEYAHTGATLALIGRDPEALWLTARLAQVVGVRAATYTVDPADAGAVERLAERVAAELGAIDVWVNAAPGLSATATTEREVKRLAEAAYLSTVYGTMSALKLMRQRIGGTVLQVTCAAGPGHPLRVVHHAVHQAVQRFTTLLQSDLKRDDAEIALAVRQVVAPAPALATAGLGGAYATAAPAPEPAARGLLATR